MLFSRAKQTFTESDIDRFAELVDHAHHAYAITGAGISTSAGIPDLQHLSAFSSMSLSSEQNLERHPQAFYQGFHRIFIDPIFQNGPTVSHRALAQLERAGKLGGVITTNVDYLHELAGNDHVADIWRSLNVNHCLQCGRVYDINILKNKVPTCPNCGGLISPDPIYYHIGIDGAAYERADEWMADADLVIVLGSNGYYSNVNRTATVVNINRARNDFDGRADLTIRGDADQVMTALMKRVG